MLRAFNGECDAAIAKVRYNNVNVMEARINKAVETINSLGQTQGCCITAEYLNVKLQELYLVREYEEKVNQESMDSIILALGAPQRLVRRLGAMFDLVSHTPAPALTSLLSTCAQNLPIDEMPFPLLPGGTYPGFNPRWKVQVP